MLSEDDKAFITATLDEYTICTFKMLSHRLHVNFEESRFMLSQYIDEILDDSILEYTVAYIEVTKSPDSAVLSTMTMVVCDPLEWRKIRKPLTAVAKGKNRTAQEIDNTDILFMNKVYSDEPKRIDDYRMFCSKRMDALTYAPSAIGRVIPQPPAHVAEESGAASKKARTMVEADKSAQPKATHIPPVVEQQEPVVVSDEPKTDLAQASTKPAQAAKAASAPAPPKKSQAAPKSMNISNFFQKKK